MKALIKTTRIITEEELNEVRAIFPSLSFTIERISDTPVPTWNPYFKLIEVDWAWFRSLFKSDKAHDVHCYVTDQATLNSINVTKYLGLYSLDADDTHEFWFGVPDRLNKRAHANGFTSNFAWLFVHELLHGKEHFAKAKDRTHDMQDQGRLKELAAEYTSPAKKKELHEKTITLSKTLRDLLLRLFIGRYQRPLPNHWTSVSQKYLNPDPVTYKQSGVHPGTDFAAPVGTPILAPDDGEITRSSYSPTLGNWVEFRFGNLYLIALHLANKQTPRQVRRGEPIGFVGSTGLINGIHAHLEVWARPMDRELLNSKGMVEALTMNITDLIR